MPKHVGIGSAVLGLCLAVGSGSCGEHVVVVDLVNLAAEATTVSAYYRIDADSYRASTVPSGQLPAGSPAIGIRPPASRDGTLNIQVLAYKSNVPCAINKGVTDVGVGASGKISATTVLDPVAYSPCSANDAPVRYPVDAKVWASAPNNVWIVGKDAAILRWDGSLFREFTLPASVLGGKRPTWKAVRGDNQGSVWLVGDGDSVVRIDASGNPTRLPIDFGATAQVPLLFTGVYAESGTAYLSGTTDGDTNGYIGIYTPATGKVSINQVDKAPINLMGKSYGLYAVDCSSLADCYYGGPESVIIHYTGGTMYKIEPLKSDKSCGSDQAFVNVSAIYATPTLATVRMVGTSGSGASKGVFISYENTARCFFAKDQDASAAFTVGALVNLGGRRPDDLIVVGTDAMYRWRTGDPVRIIGVEPGGWQSVAVVPGGFFALSQTGRIFYADVAP